MPKVRYVPKTFSRDSLVIIGLANKILVEYAKQGFTLTLRQLYYQFVARAYIPNKPTEYKRLGSIIADARLAGLIDWDYLEDRTRNLASLQHFTGAQDALNKLHQWYHVDMWERQKYRPVVFIEKDALVGVIQGVCEENDVPYFSCRGYTSLSEIYEAAQRFRKYLEKDQTPYIIHFGDHDPSGIDMSRDIVERLRETFMTDCEFERVALNMDQVQQYNPPPNPAKVTDSRYKAYLAKYGDESWELDALNPTVFRQLIIDNIDSIRDKKIWKEDAARKQTVKDRLLDISTSWEEYGKDRERAEKAEARAAEAEELVMRESAKAAEADVRAETAEDALSSLKKELAELKKATKKKGNK